MGKSQKIFVVTTSVRRGIFRYLSNYPNYNPELLNLHAEVRSTRTSSFQKDSVLSAL